MDPRSASAPRPRPAVRPWVKICGLSREEHVDRAISGGSDAVGFVHFGASPRHLDLPRIAELVAHANRRCETILVTVDPSDELLDEIVLTIAPSAIQLHGSETPARVVDVAARTGLPVVKALSVGDASFADTFRRFGAPGTRLLLDAKAPKGSALPGGNGVAFDWRLLERLEHVREIGFILSGGLNAGNVADAIRIARPFGLDVSSGVETAPGEKSADLIDRFFDALGAATQSYAGRQTP